MLQSGGYQEWLGCPAGECAKVEFRLQQVYHVHVGAKHIVIKEQDVETVRHQNQGHWKWFRPTVSKTRRIVLDRASGKILEAPGIGMRQERPKPAAAAKAPRQKRGSALVAS
jgi:hypothetical protein